MLKIENLRKVFRTDEIETIALDNVSFAIEKGDVYKRQSLIMPRRSI